MIIALTGTPGVGKSSVSEYLKKEKYQVLDILKIALDNDFVLENDEKRDSKILNINQINRYISKNYESADIIFVDSHLSHMLSYVDYVIILRCNPNILKDRLKQKNWKTEKVKENIESEILDIILCEAVQNHPEKNIFEIDTSDKSGKKVADCVKEIVNNSFKPMKKYKIGLIDWSEEILKKF